MEKSLFRKNIEQSLVTLDDLYSLGDPQLYPLIERLHFHLHEIDNGRKKDKLFFKELHKKPKTKELKNLNRIFLNEIDRLKVELFKSLPSGVKLNLINSLEEASLEQLDQIIESFPMLRETAEVFRFENTIRLWLYNDCFSFTGEVSLEVDLESLRDRAYALTRRMFNSEILFTFEIFESNTDGYFSITFHCHLKNSENQPFFVPVDEDKILKLSGLLENFKRPLSELRHLGSHQVFEIKSSLDIEELSNENIEKVSHRNDGFLFHFPFLFRPLSLIINGGSGAELSENREEWSDMCAENKLSIIELDLFSLVQK